MAESRPSPRGSNPRKIGCVQHDCAECQRRESLHRSEQAVREDSIDGLREIYTSLDDALTELDYRIGETLDLRKQLELEKEKRAPKALKARIAELERDLATVNGRLADALSDARHAKTRNEIRNNT